VPAFVGGPSHRRSTGRGDVSLDEWAWMDLEYITQMAARIWTRTSCCDDSFGSQGLGVYEL
jgi:hypothetical protein